MSELHVSQSNAYVFPQSVSIHQTDWKALCGRKEARSMLPNYYVPTR